MFEEPNLVCLLSRCSCSCNEYLPQTSLSEHIKHYKIGSKHTLLVLLYVSNIQLYLPRLPTSSNRLNDASLCKRQSHIWPKCSFFFFFISYKSFYTTNLQYCRLLFGELFVESEKVFSSLRKFQKLLPSQGHIFSLNKIEQITLFIQRK